MKKSLLLAALWCAGFTAAATPVTVNLANTMNAGHFEVTTATGTAVEVGENTGTTTKPVYSFNVDPGKYWLSIFRSTDDSPFGSIQVEIPDQADNYTLDIFAIYAYAMNRNADDNSFWVLNEDYTIPFDRISESANQGVNHEVRPVEISGLNASMPATVVAFPALKGDSYTVFFVPDAEKHPDYLQTTACRTLTSAVNATTTLPTSLTYTITVPAEGELTVGQKVGNNYYMSYIEQAPVAAVTENGKTTYTYNLATGKQTYNYRLRMGGYMEHVGKFGYSDQYPKYSFEIAKEEIESHGSASYVNHDVTDMGGGNVADLWLNINIRNHKQMKTGETYGLAPQRNWQIIDDQSNNYLFNPRFHYTVLDENFKPTDKVVTVDDNNVIHAVGAGTAIVQVSYEALYAYEYNRVDAFGSFGMDLPFWFGSRWSSIWAENTGLFVVTVDGDGECAATPNFFMDHENPGRTDVKLDCEIDVLYYFEDQPGYHYTLRPENAAKVAVANPAVNSEANTVSYEGFREVEAAADGSYDLLLTFGRNIIRVTDAAGRSVYQVISAKPMGYEVRNATNPDNGSTIYPGETANVVFHGLFHPANKLSGIYNQSAYINYNGTPNGNSLILTPNQYSFAGVESAQTYQFKVAEDATGPHELKDGSLYVRGYGSIAGKHRTIDPKVGVTPNFTAPVTTEYWGYIPDVSVPIATALPGSFEFKYLPEGSQVVVNYGASVVAPAEDNAYRYDAHTGVYSYTVSCPGYIVYHGKVTIDGEEQVVEVAPQMARVADGDNGWDGEQLSVPYVVEADEAGFEGLEGYYKIGNGYELAWIADYVNAGNKIETGMVLTSDIDLGGHQFTPIDVKTNNYLGSFYGRNHVIEGLSIENTATSGYYAALFGNLQNNAGTFSHVTVRGKISTTADYAAGLVASTRGAMKLIDVTTEVDIDGKNYVGGVAGYLYVTPTADGPLPSLCDLHHSGSLKAVSGVGGVLGYGYFNNRTYHTEGVTFSRLTHEGDIEQKANTTMNPSVGGLAGTLNGINLEDCYSFGTVAVAGKTASTGKLIGISQPASYTEPLVLTRVYALGEASNNALIGTAGSGSNVLSVKAEGVYLSGEPVTDIEGVAYMPAESFANGEVAYLLGNGWGQTIADEESHPVLGGEAVYEVAYTSSLSEQSTEVYSNAAIVEAPDFTERDGAVHRGLWLSAPDGVEVATIESDTVLFLNYPVPVLNLDSVQVRMDEVAMIDLAEHVEAPFGLPVTYWLDSESADDDVAQATWLDGMLAVLPKQVGTTGFTITFAANGFIESRTVGVKVSEAPQSGLAEVAAASGTIRAMGSRIAVTGCEGVEFRVYTTDGRLAATFTATSASHVADFAGCPGVYVVTGTNGLRAKVVIK